LALAQIATLSGPTKSITDLSQSPGGLRFEPCLDLSQNT
jgi:hypothetical protein